MDDFKRSSSQEGLKDEEAGLAGRAMYYEPHEFARHSGNVSKLSTAISGKKLQRQSDEASSTVSGPASGQPRIKVTREITSREFMGESR